MQYRKEDTGLIGSVGIGGLFAYMAGVIRGYVRGFLGEHRAAKRLGLLLIGAAVLTICLSVPVLPQLKTEAETGAAVAQAAEEAGETDPAADGEDKNINAEKTRQEGEAEAEEIETEETRTEEAEGQKKLIPLDNSVLKPSDAYAEMDSHAVFQSYHPQALNYQWEIETETGKWEEAPSEMVRERIDELQRNVSLLELKADREKTVRCRIDVGQKPAVTYAADLYILPGPVSSITVDEFHAETGKYVNAGEIPVEVTYQDGTQEVITGLSGLHFIDTEESKEHSETEAGNLKETITTVRTSSDYRSLKAGVTEETLCYKRQDGEALEVPVHMKGLDLTAPVIHELHISEFEVSSVDQPVPVTISFAAEDDVTPVRHLSYAFLPEGAEVQEDDWSGDAVLQVEITQNGIWTAYCKDEAGNIAKTDRELIVVDNKAPVISLSLQNKEGWCQGNTIYVSAEDSLPVEYRYLCTISGEDSGWTAASSRQVTVNGIWTVQVRDAAGNIAEQDVTVDNVDNQPPVIRSITEKTEGEAVKNEK